MVSYWDTSAIVPLLASEAESGRRTQQLLTVSGIVTWWGTRTEAVFALCRRERANEDTVGSSFHTSDIRLAEAATKEGFTVC